MSIDIKNISIVILAGGQARRMSGENKGLLALGGRPLLQHVLDRLPAGISIVISANSDIERYKSFGHPVIKDELAGNLGPMNGIYSALHTMSSEWLLTVPCDTPNLPLDYVDRMISQDFDAKACVADDGHRIHNGCCLLHASVQADLLEHIEQQKLAMHGFLKSIAAQRVDFSDQADAFMNINTPEQLQQAELKQGKQDD